MLREEERTASRLAGRAPAGAARAAPAAAAAPVGDPERAARINPYTRWVHEHPDVLLAEPSPAELQARLAAAGAAAPEAGPIVVDLGCGSGNYLLQRARAEPGMRFVGFELRYKRLVKAARKVERAGLHNVWFLRETAERFPSYFAPGSLAAVHVNFPDPWPRPSDWKKRMVSRALLGHLERLLAPGGRFHLKTDHSGYFLHALALLPRAPQLRLVAFSNDHHRQASLPGDVRTEFEQLFHSQRKPVYSLVLERCAPAGAA
jgi:tRNA (guanine-N7-)-methyltransferase